MLPQPLPSQSESLLFNIMEEKTQALRSILDELLGVHHRLNAQLNDSFKCTQRIIREGQCSGANVSRLTNSSQIGPLYSPPSASFNYRPLTPVIEENKTENESARTKYVQADVHVNYQPPEPQERPQLAAHNSYSDVKIIENRSASISQQNPDHNENNDDDNTIESLPESVGFKILTGLPDQSDKSQNTKKNRASQLKNQKNENVIKHLTTWSVNMKIINSPMKPSKVFILLTGTLLGKDRVTVIEKKHEAGVLKCRKENNLVKTNKGLYRLVDNIIGGHPNELYQKCLTLNGIPRTWRNFVKIISGVEKISKNELFNFSLDSPVGHRPIKSKESIQLDMTMIRRGSTYHKNTNFSNQKTSAKIKILENDVPEYSKNEQHNVHELSTLLASTPKKPIKLTVNDDDVIDFFMSSPRKLSVKYPSDKSRSETQYSCNTVLKHINNIIEFGEQYDDDDDD